MTAKVLIQSLTAKVLSLLHIITRIVKGGDLNNNITIRKAGNEDIHLLSQMLAGLFSIEDDFEIDSAKQSKALEMIISGTTGSAIMIAESDSIITGMVSLQKVVSTASGGYSVLLEDLYVLPEYRDRGIGKCLTDYADQWGRENDAVRIQLAADKRNRAAADFYKAGGFSESNMLCFYKYI